MIRIFQFTVLTGSSHSDLNFFSNNATKSSKLKCGRHLMYRRRARGSSGLTYKISPKFV